MMRRALPLAAVSLALGAGCLVEPAAPSGSVAIYWTFWSQSLGDIGAAGDPASSVCAAAGVEDLRITLTDPAGDVLAPATGSCVTANDVPGAAFVGLEPGTWGYLLEARRAGQVAYAVAGTFDVVAGERAIADARAKPPAERWDVVVAVTTNGCATGDRLDFDLFDTGGGTRTKVYSTRDATVNPVVAVPCALAEAVVVPSVAPGTYEFSDWVQVDAAGATVAVGTCRPSWTQTATGDAYPAVSVTASPDSPPPVGNGGVCL